MSSAPQTGGGAAARALAQIKGLAGAFRITFTSHARARMMLRDASIDDVREALMTATRCESRGEPKWKVMGGHDMEGDELTVVVLLLEAVVVVTAY